LFGSTLQFVQLGLRLGEQPNGTLMGRHQLLEGSCADRQVGDRSLELSEKLF
jgi:hypothetical protein